MTRQLVQPERITVAQRVAEVRQLAAEQTDSGLAQMFLSAAEDLERKQAITTS